MKKKLLDLLACPKCKSALEHLPRTNELVCTQCTVIYPVRDGIPVLLETEAVEIQK